MASQPMKARRTDAPGRVFAVTQEQLMTMKPADLAKLEVDFGAGWQRPARFMSSGEDFLPMAEDDE